MAKTCNSKCSIFWLFNGGSCVSTVSLIGLASLIGLVFDVDAACAWQKQFNFISIRIQTKKNCIRSSSQILTKCTMFKSFRHLQKQLFQKSQSLWYLPRNSQVWSSTSQASWLVETLCFLTAGAEEIHRRVAYLSRSAEFNSLSSLDASNIKSKKKGT